MPYYPPPLASPLTIAQGGTGSATQNFVDLTTTQTVGGLKTLSSKLVLSGGAESGGNIRVFSDGGIGFIFDGSLLSPAKNVWNLKQGSDGTFLFDNGGGLSGRFKLGGVAAGTFWDFTPDFTNSYFKITDSKVVTTFNNTLDDGSGGMSLVGSLTLADATNIVVNTTTGTKIGTSTSQKLGFFNATPVVQQGATTDLGTVLSSLGFRASGSAYTLTTTGAVGTGQLIVNNSSSTSFVAGHNGTTNPQFVVDSSTASVATGLNIKGAAAAGGLAVSVISSGTNESMTLSAKGTGIVTISSQLTLATGTTTLAPLVIPNGTVLTSPLANAIESDGNSLYWTTSGSSRQTLANTFQAQTFANKTIDATNNTITNVANHSIARQNNTTNSTTGGVRIETGWGVMAQGAAANKSEAVTFGTAFTTAPIVIITFGGDQTGGTIAYGNGGNTEKGPVTSKAYSVTTAGFTAHMHTSDGTSWSATANVYYQWFAIGA